MTLYKVLIYYKDGTSEFRWFGFEHQAEAFAKEVHAEYDQNIRRAGEVIEERICTSKRPVRNSDIAAWMQSKEKRS